MGSYGHDCRGRASRFGRLARRRSVSGAALAMVAAIAVVGHGWAGTAAAQDAPVAPSVAPPYRDLAAGAGPIRAAPPAPLQAGPPAPMRRVVIVAFFTYDCTSCQGLEADLADWQRALPSGARVVRVPAIFSRLSRLHAQAFYAATKLGKLQDLDRTLYAAVQRDPQRLDSVDALAGLFASFGVERDAFAAAFDSLEVQIELDRAAQQTRRYGVTAAPALVVGSRYLTTPEIAGSSEAMLTAARERVAALRRACRGAGCTDAPF